MAAVCTSELTDCVKSMPALCKHGRLEGGVLWHKACEVPDGAIGYVRELTH